MNPIQPLLTRAALTLITAALVACGGGGGGGGDSAIPDPVTPTNPATLSLANAQGFWSATPSATTSVGAVILPNGQAWVIYQTGNTLSALAQGSLSVSGSTYTGVGKHYSLPGGAVQDFSLRANLGISSTATNNVTLVSTTTVGTNSSSTMAWVYDKTYESGATQASVQGRWSGVQGAVSLILDIDAAGKLAGTSTAGCTYTGTITPNASPIAVLDVAIAENCPGTLKTLSGIATLNTAKTGLYVAYTTAAGAQGGAVVLQK